MKIRRILTRTAKALFKAAKPVIIGAIVTAAASRAQAGVERLTGRRP